MNKQPRGSTGSARIGRWTITALVLLAMNAGRQAAGKGRPDLLISVKPGGAGDTATLVVHGGAPVRRSQGDPVLGPIILSDYGAAVVRSGHSVLRAAPGQRRETKIAASASVLQEMKIGTSLVLASVKTGAVLTIAGQPCSLWRLSSQELDPDRAGAPSVYCTRAKETCRAPFVDAPDGKMAVDPLCPTDLGRSGDNKRCMKPAMARFLAQTRTEVVLRTAIGDLLATAIAEPGIPTAYFPVPIGSCGGLVEVDTGKSKFFLALGLGEAWTVGLLPTGQVAGTRDAP